MTDVAAELAACEEEMTQGMRLTLLFSLISTPQFGAFVRNEDAEFDQLPSNPARDFFLRNIDFEPYLSETSPSEKAVVIREFHQMAYLLNIRTLSMKLDQSDWRIASKVMLALVLESLDNKTLIGGPGASSSLQTFIAKAKTNVGQLSEQEQTLWRLIM